MNECPAGAAARWAMDTWHNVYMPKRAGAEMLNWLSGVWTTRR